MEVLKAGVDTSIIAESWLVAVGKLHELPHHANKDF